MGRLLELANQLTGVKVPSVPSLKNHMEPLQPSPLLASPSVPPVPCATHKVEKPAQESNLQKRGRLRLTTLGLEVEPSAQSSAPTPEAIAWLARVARLLECSPDYLLTHRFIDRHDLIEQYATHPRFAAQLIRSNPAWTTPVGNSNNKE